MSEELFGLSIVLDVAGPGQHVPVVERKIQKIEERVRAHENSLPYVMTRLMLMICVLICESQLNLQSSSMSVDRTSLLEHFTGRKINAARDLRVCRKFRESAGDETKDR